MHSMHKFTKQTHTHTSQPRHLSFICCNLHLVCLLKLSICYHDNVQNFFICPSLHFNFSGAYLENKHLYEEPLHTEGKKKPRGLKVMCLVHLCFHSILFPSLSNLFRFLSSSFMTRPAMSTRAL